MAQNYDSITGQVLIVDDEVELAKSIGEALQRLGHVCTIVHDLPSAEDELRHGSFDLIVTDLRMENEDDGLKVLAATQQTQTNAECIMVTAYGDVKTTKAAIGGGAFDFIEKPLDLNILRNRCQRAIEKAVMKMQNRQLREQVDEKFGLEGIIGNSPAIRRVLTLVRQIAPTDIPVLITGESGTGKELVARAIHGNSPRARKNFKPLNCAGLSASILESELFGHVKGAFTGAERDRQGVFEYANGGTLFLDEIGDMPLEMQAKLLRVLENGEIVRVGSNEPRHANVRLLAATNHELEKLTEQKQFREDLYFRIRGAHIHLPPLRDRREDIPLLVRHFAGQFANKMDKQTVDIEDEAMNVLVQFDWPGNVRQLINTVQNMVLVCAAQAIELQHIPVELRSGSPVEVSAQSLDNLAGLSLEQLEKLAIRNALGMYKGNREKAAKMLGIGERTLYRKLNEYGIK